MRIALLGFGTVGRELSRILLERREKLKRDFGFEPEIVAAADSKGVVNNPGGFDIQRLLDVKKENGSVVDGDWSRGMDVDYDVLVECTPTNIEDGEPGLSNILDALNNGKDVVTSNKGPLALEWSRLMDAADRNNCVLKFEASVGGAMPVINLANEVLAGNKINGVRGILNGTCNYILTRMTAEGLPYNHVLSEAQDLGIAETDPTYDVEGIDTALKVVIIANSVLDMNATYDDVELEGITGITPEALELAKKDNKVVKLIGEIHDSQLEVAPKMVSSDHPIAVGGTLNVASVKADLAGEITVTGKGAGGKETASSILSDLVSIWRNNKH
ncbi:homoserine dehydrogenase [Methanonatronarchaeum sp. AMET6-2]|uniref:homoserine dehydrogenase n=1 Tax=Methanonatronarchaeum sp. AMET6-2 TaxID=2933293 RepID=UPI00120BBBDD|nr:homoserine dehydrogenase [Methanonatronarchaeum sp. AMET6-2]RZN62667.1 MAG: homoserine dehydrogenase [Methanonatronarchaeia archaeon]UOY10326.1 homoserine dehydrogenase [Methanonatronarchaeum sp. AMET6-2]